MPSKLDSKFNINVLHPTIVDWIHKTREWKDLKTIQKYAIEHIVTRHDKGDLILSAPTSGGKTMAAFIPLINILAYKENLRGYQILYICPTKALISQQAKDSKNENEQSDLVNLASKFNLEVTPWMGDVSSSVKQKSADNPGGILIITPESLEGRFVKGQNEIFNNFSNVSAIVIDELHAYFESSRGYQIISLLSRLESIINRRVPRIAMSATLGNGSDQDWKKIYNFLRPGVKIFPKKMESIPEEKEIVINLTILCKKESDKPEQLNERIAKQISSIYNTKSKGIIFTNSRKDAEEFSKHLNKNTSPVKLPKDWHKEPKKANDKGASDAYKPWNDFKRYWAHHGSLDKAIRNEAEKRMRDDDVPCILVATTTLELGIDVGTIKEVVQVGPGYSVSSLRQRLGRSGRIHFSKKNGILQIDPETVPKLHAFLREGKKDEDDHFINKLRLATFQLLAQVSLLRSGQFESPNLNTLQASTFVQQILSLVHQRRYNGGITISEVKEILLENGPFAQFKNKMFEGSKDSFSIFEAVLKKFFTARPSLLLIDNDNTLHCTKEGTKVIESPFFSTSFKASQEYTLRTSGGTIMGTASIGNYGVGDRILYNGKSWEILGVDHRFKRIDVKPVQGTSTINFYGDSMEPSQEVVTKMRELYSMDEKTFKKHIETILNKKTDESEVIEEGRKTYQAISDSSIKMIGGDIFWFPWVGDRLMRGVCSALNFVGISATPFRIAIFIHGLQLNDLKPRVDSLVDNFPSLEQLSLNSGANSVGKFDYHLWPSFWRKEHEYSISSQHEIITALKIFSKNISDHKKK